ncbi:MAG: hypothetical protein NC084_08895 [Bacteroides sp.]|nr:hypothetical protein [Eubacterium sp.]MCM1418745.1 hypothetical protein [Roseburia sp.]MCM1462813.1 hypothetical protein [Bacteroides sp.]
MRPAWNRVKKIDIYSPGEVADPYLGTRIEPRLLGYVYADVQGNAETLENLREGTRERRGVRLFLRPDAGIKCGDLAAVYGKAPDSRIIEVRRAGEYVAATAERL